MNNVNSLVLKTLIPVSIGVAVVVWLLSQEFSIEQWRAIPWTTTTFISIALAIACVVGREWGMMWRFRVLTDRKLSWRKSLNG